MLDSKLFCGNAKIPEVLRMVTGIFEKFEKCLKSNTPSHHNCKYFRPVSVIIPRLFLQNTFMIYTKDHFSENLFWDVRFEDIDFQKHAPYVVQRILEYGADQDWRQLVSIYGINRIGEIAINLRSLEPRAMSFIAAITNHSKEDFRCYTLKQSNLQLWTY